MGIALVHRLCAIFVASRGSLRLRCFSSSSLRYMLLVMPHSADKLRFFLEARIATISRLAKCLLAKCNKCSHAAPRAIYLSNALLCTRAQAYGISAFSFFHTVFPTIFNAHAVLFVPVTAHNYRIARHTSFTITKCDPFVIVYTPTSFYTFRYRRYYSHFIFTHVEVFRQRASFSMS